ncbi:MAG: 50S ribosomal protein L32 [Bacteroidota bacterium]|nr:50S ribosomal protein L32 [Bacteroidota bacterium]
MPHPKRKISKSRRDSRRAHHSLDSKALFIDPQSGDVSLYHRVNLETGMYRGHKVMKGRNEE